MSEELYRTLVVKLTMLKEREITALDVLDFMDSFLQYAESCSGAPLILSGREEEERYQDVADQLLDMFDPFTDQDISARLQESLDLLTLQMILGREEAGDPDTTMKARRLQQLLL
ncbi:MAG: hypothetical protein II189_06235 [Lachnospiraceae bacterium]|nr:hypothetical protein [Lachnospiraceae bacterium]MBQ3973008.1 hypothetical protein [Lachnospiraceae bacterium]